MAVRQCFLVFAISWNVRDNLGDYLHFHLKLSSLRSTPHCHSPRCKQQSMHIAWFTCYSCGFFRAVLTVARVSSHQELSWQTIQQLPLRSFGLRTKLFVICRSMFSPQRAGFQEHSRDISWWRVHRQDSETRMTICRDTDYSPLDPVDHHLPSIPLHLAKNLVVHTLHFPKLRRRHWQSDSTMK